MTSKTVAPFGKWESPISAESIAKSGNSFADVLVDKVTSKIYYLENRPSESGRGVLVDAETKNDVFGSGWNARSGVHEYGGAPAIVHDNTVYFSHFLDGRIYRTVIAPESDSTPVSVTQENKNYRYADLEVHPTSKQLIVSILEDHTLPTPADVVNTLVTINTDRSTVHPLIAGASFYASPRFSPDGKYLAWLQWNHPDMPWDGAELYVAEVIISSDVSALEIKNTRKIKGNYRSESASQPFWVGPNTILFSCDTTGYQNPWIVNVSSSILEPRLLLSKALDEDFALPLWRLGASYFAVLSSKKVLSTAIRDGRSVLYLIDIISGEQQEILSPYVSIQALRATSPSSAVFLGGTADTPTALVSIILDFDSDDLPFRFVDLAGGDASLSPEDNFDKSDISLPQALTFKGSDGGPLHVVFYAPVNSKYEAPKGERPPCIVSAHGGPTGMTTQELKMKTQFFTSRGFAWVDVNYAGSSGYGRRYVERLDGQWGVADVSDCVDAAQELASPSFGQVDPSRVLITGGSAGGYTVLQSLCSAPSGAFAAGTSSYGISNLFTLVEDTHKFESQYMNKLLGGTPKEIPEVYRERSPVFHAEKIKAPLLILQGAEDKVVPPSQAEDMKKVIEEHGGHVEYELYQGEGHGWRRSETIVAALERELGFYRSVLGLA